MKFLVDAQLPARLARYLRDAGHDCAHTSDLLGGNYASDAAIAERADAEDRAVITKDSDFRDSHLLGKSPQCLLVVGTGNITNNDLIAMFQAHLPRSSPRSMSRPIWSCAATG